MMYNGNKYGEEYDAAAKRIVRDNTSGNKTISAAEPNTVYSFGTISGITITSFTAPTTFTKMIGGVETTFYRRAEYIFEFTLAEQVGTIAFPVSVIWSNGEPDWVGGEHYEVSVMYCAGNGNYYALCSNGESSGGGSNVTPFYTPTLQSAPTSSTTTYIKNEQTIDFVLGQFCRVANASAESGYDFYQLNDISVTGNVTTATWEKVVVESEKENVTKIVAPVNQTDATEPITTLSCDVGKMYRIDVAVETLAITLPAISDATTAKNVVLYLTGGTTPAITISSTAPSGGVAPSVYYQNGYEIESGKTYEINCLWNGASWIVAAIEINVN